MGENSNTHCKHVSYGAPSEHLYPVDNVSPRDVGFDMFKGRQKFKANFIESDIVHPTFEIFAMNGTVDMISTSKLFRQGIETGSYLRCGV